MQQTVPATVPLSGNLQYPAPGAIDPGFETKNHVTGDRVYSCVVTNNSGADAYLYLNDKASNIIDGDAPLFPPIKLAAGETKGWGPFPELPLRFALGIAFGLSSTLATFAGAPSGKFFLQYANKTAQ